MDKMIVVVFDNEKSAYEGERALRELHDEGSITLYADAVITKDSQDTVSVMKSADQGPMGTALGLTTGSLIGLLGGPVGVAIGAMAGTLSGALYDTAHLGVSEDFLYEVSQRLTPGKTAVVAEVDENWVTPLDLRMESLGGFIIRRPRAEFIDAQIEREIAADEAELAQMEEEYDQAVGEAKANLQQKIQATKQKLKARSDQLNDKIDAMQNEADAKIKLLHDQAEKAKSENRAAQEELITEARAVQMARVEKLKKAWERLKDAAA